MGTNKRTVLNKNENSFKKKMSNKGIIFGIIISVVIALAIGLGVYYSPNNRISRQLDLGQKYLEMQNYEQAIYAFNEAITIDPMCVEAYLGLADAHVGLDDLESALSVLKCGYELTQDERINAKIGLLKSNTGKSDKSKESEADIKESAGEEAVDNTVENTKEGTEENTEIESTERTEEIETTESAEAQATGFVITEEEFEYRVMFHLPIELFPVDDEFSKELIAAIDSILAKQGKVKEYCGPDMIGRCYPIRFGEDVQSSAEGIVADMESYFMDGGYRYDIHHVKKAENGYMVTYSIE